MRPSDIWGPRFSTYTRFCATEFRTGAAPRGYDHLRNSRAATGVHSVVIVTLAPDATVVVRGLSGREFGRVVDTPLEQPTVRRHGPHGGTTLRIRRQQGERSGGMRPPATVVSSANRPMCS